MRLRLAVVLIGAAVLLVACGKAPTEPGGPSLISEPTTPAPTHVAVTPVYRPVPTPTPEGAPCHPMPKCLQDE